MRIALTTLALLLLIALIGIVRSARSRRQRRLREDVLKRFHQCERQRRPVDLEALAGMLDVHVGRAHQALEGLLSDGLVRSERGRLALTESGRETARVLVRRHRVIETYLADRKGVPLGALHRRADRLEHRLSVEATDELDRSMGRPLRDPHGDLIPRESDASQAQTAIRPSVPLDLCPAGTTVEVQHVEDEPVSLFSDLYQQGIVPGARLEIVRRDDTGIGVTLAGFGDVWLPAPAAGQIDVVPFREQADEIDAIVRLDALPIGRAGRVILLTSDLRGEQRRRLLDLGFTPGTPVRPVLTNALGADPTAYLVRQSKIGLRREQARHVLVAPIDEPDENATPIAEPSGAADVASATESRP